MNNPNFNRLFEWASSKDIGIRIDYWPGLEGHAEIEAYSAAPIECYYMKRCSDIEYFISEWEDNFKRGLEKQNHPISR